MITTIAIAAATGFAGLAIGTGAATAATLGLRRRLSTVEDLIETELVSKAQISEAFMQISAMEQQREAAIAQQLSQMRAQITQVQPVFRPGAASGSFPGPGLGADQVAPSAAEVNALLTQQLSALNQRLQQVTSQQMPS